MKKIFTLSSVAIFTSFSMANFVAVIMDQHSHLDKEDPIMIPEIPLPPATQTMKIMASNANDGAYFGSSVDISGSTAIIGALYEATGGSNTGSAYIYEIGDSTWTETSILKASNKTDNSFFGGDVAISGDIAIVGANGANGSNGAAYIFKRDGNTWSEQAILTANGNPSGTAFGFSVDISNDTAVVGAWSDSGEAFFAGAAYIFKYNGSAWIQEARISANDASSSAYFGKAVAINGDTIIAGASSDNINGTKTGSAYIFKNNGSTWTQQAKLIANDKEDSDYFGDSVDISDDKAIIGAWGEDSEGSNAGAAYIFKNNGSTWIQEQKILAKDAQFGDQFGNSVAISDNLAVVGAYGKRTKGSSTGAAYVFENNGSNWIQKSKLVSLDAEAQDEFAESIAISGDTAIIGAHTEDEKGSNAGAAYIFEP